jgi:tetratricopeptide (TPR) repeat protein
MDIDQLIKLKYRDEFRSVHRDAFQHWFERLAFALHGKDFLAIHQTRGDGGLDGLVLYKGKVYQLHAPDTPDVETQTRDQYVAEKIKNDFNKAKQTIGNSLKFWTFICNRSDGKFGKLTAEALTQLTINNPNITIEAIGIDGLWELLDTLPKEKLASLFDISIPPNNIESQIRVLLNHASDLANQGKRRLAFEAMEQALAVAKTENIINLQAEVLIGLSLISSAQDGIGDRAHYFQQLQLLKNNITEVPVLVMFHRSRGAYLEETHKTQEAESAYLTAIDLASLPANEESCADQLCVTRSEYVNLLCNSNRTSEAKDHLLLAETYANSNPEFLKGEVFQAALNAGLHWAAKTGDEEGVIERINVLEASANTAYRALIIAEQLINNSNNLSHIELHHAALAASEAALRLTDKISKDTRKNFLPGVLYTVAMINFHAGHFENALQKANSLVNISDRQEFAPIRFAASQLVSVISRQIGDLDAAVSAAELAVSLAPDIDSSCMAKMNFAEVLADCGKTELALKAAQEALCLIHGRNVPMDVRVEILGHIADYSAQLGVDGLQCAMSMCNGQVKPDTFLSHFTIKFPLKSQRRLIA